jgi:hypothetical protein
MDSNDNPLPERQQSDSSSSTQAVGYGKPPQSTRFQKGVSGNPKGRPKGSLNVASLFLRTLREKVVVNENGRRKTVTKLEAALKQLVNKAASGDLRALQQLVALATDAEQKQNLATTQNPVLNDLDQEVVESILSRFHPVTNNPQDEEATDGEDDRK